MARARRSLLLTPVVLLAACAQLQGLGDVQRVACLEPCPGEAGASEDAADGGVAPVVDGAAAQDSAADVDAASDAADAAKLPADAGAPPADASGEDGPAAVASWSFSRTITLTSDAPAALANEPVLVVVPATFVASHAKAAGDDLRFSTSATHSDDLPYFIESWSAGAESFVWVRVPTVPVGASTITMFYGNPSATAASSFPAAFPGAMQTAGAGAGSFIATGDITVDWFELRAGDTIILPQGVPLQITARRVILSGIVGGDGRGAAGGAAPNGVGGGSGGGAPSNPVDTQSSGGGGNAGVGGHGGGSVAANAGAGGAAIGTATGDDIAVGSGGAAANANAGGAGGGAVTVVGWRTTVANVMRTDGLQNVGGSVTNGGGGAGGDIIVAGDLLDLSTATLTAVGGAGGECTVPAGSGGGGGSGGRIKLKVHPGGALSAPATMSVTAGPGGTCAGSTAPGAPGSTGTTSVDNAATLATGVSAAVGDERSE